MAQPRWNTSQPDWLHLGEETGRSGIKTARTRTFPDADVGIRSDHDMVMMTFQTRLKKSRKSTQPRSMFDLEKLNDRTLMSAFHETISGRFAPLDTLVDEDAHLDSMVTHFNKVVTDTAAELLGKQRRKRKPWVTPGVLNLCDQRQDLKKKREAVQKEPKTIEWLRSGQRWRWDEDAKRLGYRFNARKRKRASEIITQRKHTS